MSVFKKIKKKVRHKLRDWVFALVDGTGNRETVIEDKTLVIVKNDFIGDYILFRNFLPYIRESEAYKGYKIILIGNINWKSLAEELDSEYFDEMIWLSFDRLFSDLAYRAEAVKPILTRGFDTLFYPVFSGDSYTEDFFIAKLNARKKVKFTTEISKGNASQTFNELIYTANRKLFELYRYKEMFELFFKISDIKSQWRSLKPAVPINVNLPGAPYIVFFPGSSAYLKRWDTSNFIHVAKYLLAHYPLASIVVTGSKKDRKYADAIVQGLNEQERKNVFDYTGKTSLLELAYVIEHSELLVTNDSVSIHIAASFNKSAVCVFMGENYGRFAPYPKEWYSHGAFIVPEEVGQLVKLKQAEGSNAPVFLDLDYNPDINSIRPDVVIHAIDTLFTRQAVTKE